MTDPWIPKFQHLRSKVRHLEALSDEELAGLERMAEELHAAANDDAPGDKAVRQFAELARQTIAGARIIRFTQRHRRI